MTDVILISDIIYVSGSNDSIMRHYGSLMNIHTLSLIYLVIWQYI